MQPPSFDMPIFTPTTRPTITSEIAMLLHKINVKKYLKKTDLNILLVGKLLILMTAFKEVLTNGAECALGYFNHSEHHKYALCSKL